MLLMLIDTPDPRYRDGFDPDDERERRWKPVSLRLFMPFAGSISCFALAPVSTTSFLGWGLTVGGVALGAQFVRVSLRDDPPRRKRRRSAEHDRD